MAKKYVNVTGRVPSSEDWYPTAPDGTVRVHLSWGYARDGRAMIGIWGNDDHGMEKLFDSLSEAKVAYHKIIAQADLTHQFLKDLGFDPA